MKARLGIRLGDILLMIMLLLLAVGLFVIPLLQARAATAEIVIMETGQVRTVSLADDATYEVSAREVHLTVCVRDGEIFVSESDCRDGVCRNTPPISRGGQSIVCAPAGIMVRITGEEVLVDGVSR